MWWLQWGPYGCMVITAVFAFCNCFISWCSKRASKSHTFDAVQNKATADDTPGFAKVDLVFDHSAAASMTFPSPRASFESEQIVQGVVEDENEIDDDVDDDEDDDDDDDDDEKKKNKKDKGGSAARGKSAASSSSSSRDAREVRVLAVRFLGALFARHPGFDYSAYWPMVLKALSPMAARKAAESGAAAPPPALAVVAALADDERLAPLLTTSGGAVGWCKSELV